MRFRRVFFGLLVVALLGATSTTLAQSSPPTAQSAGVDTGRDKARPIASAALAAYDAGQFADAIAFFSQADAIFPAPQYRLYIARSFAKTGKLASAARTYRAAISMAPPPGAEGDYSVTQSAAAAELAAIRTRVPVATVAVLGDPTAKWQVNLDGATLAPTSLLRIEIDPGAHTFVATAPGFATDTATVSVAESTFTTIELRLNPLPRLVEKPPVVTPPPVVVGVRGPQSGSDIRLHGGPAPEPSPDSHRWKPGISLRADIDPIAGGVLFAPGLSLGVLDHFEVGVAALIGRDFGVEPVARAFFLRGRWKPLAEVAAPIFIVDGPHVGVRGAAGVQWDFLPHFGVFVEVGGAFFPSPPPGYESAYLLPSLGVQGRL